MVVGGDKKFEVFADGQRNALARAGWLVQRLTVPRQHAWAGDDQCFETDFCECRFHLALDAIDKMFRGKMVFTAPVQKEGDGKSFVRRVDPEPFKKKS